MVTDYLLDLYLGGHFDVDADDLEDTMIWENPDIDWKAWEKKPSSMLVPVVLKKPRTSAVGAGSYYVRSVTGVTFPGLCYLLGDQFTATQIEAAWLDLPLIKPGKKNRGKKGRKRSRQW